MPVADISLAARQPKVPVPCFPYINCIGYIGLPQLTGGYALLLAYGFCGSPGKEGRGRRNSRLCHLCAAHHRWLSSGRKKPDQYGMFEEMSFAPPPCRGTRRIVLWKCLAHLYIPLQAELSPQQQEQAVGYSSRIKTDSVRAPCAPSTSDCSMSAVLEGPAMKVPNP